MKKPERKKTSLAQSCKESKQALRETFLERPARWVDETRSRLDNLPKTNFDLGVKFTEEGKYRDALFRFRVTRFLQPSYPMLHLEEGNCYYRMGKMDEASKALLLALKETPNNPLIPLMLESIDPALLPADKRPKRMPASLVIDFFSGMAATYDIDEAKQGYQAGKLVHDLARPLVAATNPVVIDLGCGTGIASRPWRAQAASIHGVDVTPAMVALAEKATHAERRLFNGLFNVDLLTMPTTIELPTADLVMLVNVVQYLGDLAPVMQRVATLMQPAGILVMTVEPHTTPSGYGISLDSGRFTHGAEYVIKAASAAGLKLVKQQPLAMYPDIVSQGYVLTKGGA
jgi:predicted TPR repeat methyltransferase